jgi:threonylcarbamoyladenosine tRNA methylthiotransferase MtaB
MKYAVVTFGCRVNQADTLGFEEDLLARGAIPAPPEQADLVVVNTCSVTATADQGARQTIRRIARDNPAARIVVTGCYATRRPDEVAALPGVARVVANEDKPRLLPIISSDLEMTTAERFGEGDGACGASIEPGIGGRTCFTLRVQTGCAERCSYCIIPATRGRPRSVRVEEIVSEVDRIAAAGFKEIALTGVHLGSFGRDLDPAISLVTLLRTLTTRRGVLFRISSLEPMDCPSELIDLVADSGSFAAHFHLPLQHASNRLLADMRRPYSIEYFTTLVNGIRARIPHASIGSDVIVGFPGETDEDFDGLDSYLESSPLTHVHVFPYSDRPGTVAAAMRARVPGSVVRERGRRIRERSAQLSNAFRKSQIGSVRPGLTIEDGTTVVTDNYLKLGIPAGVVRNTPVRVRVLSPHEGEVV